MKNVTRYLTGLLIMLAVLTGCKTASRKEQAVIPPLPYNTIMPPLPENTFVLGGPSPRPQTNLFAIQLAWYPSPDSNLGYALYCSSNKPPNTYNIRFTTTNTLNYFNTNCTVIVDRLSPTNLYRFNVTTRALDTNGTELESDFPPEPEVVVPFPATNALTVTATPQINTNGSWTSLETNLSYRVVNPIEVEFFRGLVSVLSWDTNNVVSLNFTLEHSTNFNSWMPLPLTLGLVLQQVPANALLNSRLDITRWNNQNYQKTTNGVPSTIPIFVLK